MDWQSVLQNIGSFAFASGTISFLIKVLFEKLLSTDIENHKNKLALEQESFKGKLALDLEKYKEELKRTSLEHEVKFTRLHEKRATVISQLYKRIVELDKATNILNFELNSQEGKEKSVQTTTIENLYNCFNGFYGYFADNQIFFSSRICDLINDLAKTYCDRYAIEPNFGLIDYRINSECQISEWINNYYSTMIESIKKQLENCLPSCLRPVPQDKLKILRAEVIKEFREILGVK